MTNQQTLIDSVLNCIESLLDKSALNPDEIVQVLDCLKVRYGSWQ